MDKIELAYLYKFYGCWQITVGLFASIALFSIWNHITKEQESIGKDLGLMWLSLAVLVWAISGFVDVNYSNNLLTNPKIKLSKTAYEGVRSILSVLNSAFILLALPCFRHIPKLVEPIIKSDIWRFVVIITFMLSVLLTGLMLLGILLPAKTSFIYVVDFIYAIFTLVFLGTVLWASFEKRGLQVLAWLSVFCIGCTLVAQVLKLDDPEFWSIFFNLTFKTVLIMLFFALALSWVDELSKTYLPSPKDMQLAFNRQRNAAGKMANNIVLTVPPKIQNQQITFTDKPYQLLHKFAEARKNAQSPEEGWLEIQPKSPKAGQYDIKDYNEITRILDIMLNATIGPKKWTADEDRKALKNALFEYDSRKIRLRVDGERIDL